MDRIDAVALMQQIERAFRGPQPPPTAEVFRTIPVEWAIQLVREIIAERVEPGGGALCGGKA
jgi:hypothetical protein